MWFREKQKIALECEFFLNVNSHFHHYCLQYIRSKVYKSTFSIYYRISKWEFVGIMIDVLKLRKNLCICRHFQGLNKGSIFRPDKTSIFGTKAKKKMYLDVWLVDFFSPSQTDVSDTTSLFILQVSIYF